MLACSSHLLPPPQRQAANRVSQQHHFLPGHKSGVLPFVGRVVSNRGPARGHSWPETERWQRRGAVLPSDLEQPAAGEVDQPQREG